jgi:hypothetical protein
MALAASFVVIKKGSFEMKKPGCLTISEVLPVVKTILREN